MSPRRLYIGLWLRMTVALLFGAIGFVVLLAVEFVLAAVVSFFLFVFGPSLGVIIVFLYFSLALFLILSWRAGWLERDLVASTNEDGTGGDSDEGSSVQEYALTVRQAWSVTALVVGGGLGWILGYHLVFQVADLDLLTVSLAVGGLFVVSFNGWVVYDELRSVGIREELEAKYTLASEPELAEETQRRVRRLALQADTSTPDVEITASALPQAATVGYRPENSVILVSRGLVKTLDNEELDAVLAHELAHLINRDAAVMTLLSMPRTKVRKLFRFVSLDWLYERTETAGSNPGLLIWVSIASAPVYVMNRLVVPMVGRHREHVADHVAGELTGSHAAMASALATLDRTYSVHTTRDLRLRWSTAAFGIVPPPWEERKVLDGLIRFFRRRILGSHPPTESRIERLRKQAG